jgi:hypothetical protein
LNFQTSPCCWLASLLAPLGVADGELDVVLPEPAQAARVSAAIETIDTMAHATVMRVQCFV